MSDLRPFLHAPGAFLPVLAFGTTPQPMEQTGLDGLFAALYFNSRSFVQELRLQLVRLGVAFPTQSFRLTKFRIIEADLAAVPLEQKHNCRVNLHLELRQQLADELQSSPFGGYGVLMFGYLFVLWFAPPQDRTFADAACRVLDRLPLRCQGVQSASYPQIQDMQTAGQLFPQLESRIQFYDTGTWEPFVTGDVDIDRLLDSAQRVQFEQRLEADAERICGALAAQDRPTALEYFRRSLTAIAQNSQGLPFPSALRNSTLRFWEILQFHLAHQDIIDLKLLRTLDFSRTFMDAGTVAAFVGKADGVVDQLLEQVARRSDEQDRVLLEKMAVYVRSIALQPDACLTLVAKEFHLEPRDIAQRFRQCYGYSVKDLIHQVRVQRAKELLAAQELSVQQIADQVGYLSLATMYRAFQKYEGVAPGKLRNK